MFSCKMFGWQKDLWRQASILGSMMRHRLYHRQHSVCKYGTPVCARVPLKSWDHLLNHSNCCKGTFHIISMNHMHRYTRDTGMGARMSSFVGSQDENMKKTQQDASVNNIPSEKKETSKVSSEIVYSQQKLVDSRCQRHSSGSEHNLSDTQTTKSSGGVQQSESLDNEGNCAFKESTSLFNNHVDRVSEGDLERGSMDYRIQSLSNSDSIVPVGINEEVDVSNLTPIVPARAHNLAAYVNESETLSNFVKLGVNLSVIEKDKKIASFLVRLDFKRDVQPYLLFLLNSGVKGSDLGRLITKNPAVFKEHISDLEVRFNYLISKKFSKDAIGRIFSKAPSLLSMKTVDIDKRLGYLQKEFHLSGNEVRTVVTSHPQITTWEAITLQENILAFGEFMGFTDYEQKQILLAAPKLYHKGTDGLLDKFDYLHNSMGLSHETLLDWPDVFRTRLHIIRQRHQFLKVMARNQFNPAKEHFVSLKALVTGSDEDFCTKIAKCDVSLFNDFLKTI